MKKLTGKQRHNNLYKGILENIKSLIKYIQILVFYTITL